MDYLILHGTTCLSGMIANSGFSPSHYLSAGSQLSPLIPDTPTSSPSGRPPSHA